MVVLCAHTIFISRSVPQALHISTTAGLSKIYLLSRRWEKERVWRDLGVKKNEPKSRFFFPWCVCVIHPGLCWRSTDQQKWPSHEIMGRRNKTYSLPRNTQCVVCTSLIDATENEREEGMFSCTVQSEFCNYALVLKTKEYPWCKEELKRIVLIRTR